jgi:bacteriocin biosynthesis cyclodehydratase domain-containing protein
MLRPKVKDYYEIVPEAEDRFQLRSSEKTAVLSGAIARDILSKLLPLLDGTSTVDEIIVRLGLAEKSDLVREVINRLHQAGFIEDAESVYCSSAFRDAELRAYQRQLIFFELATESASGVEYQARLKHTRLAILGAGELARRVALEAASVGVGHVFVANCIDDDINALNPWITFEAGRLPIEDRDAVKEAVTKQEPQLLMLALDRPEPGLLTWANDLSQDTRLPLLHCQIHGIEAVVGPFVLPGQTACLLCHHLRVSRNLDYFSEYRAWETWVTKDPRRRRALTGNLSPLTAMAGGLAVLELIKHAAGFYQPETYGRFVTINALTLEVTTHDILKLPRCRCGQNGKKSSLSPWQGL